MEAEGRVFRRALLRTLWAVALLSVIAVFLVFAVGLWLWAAYLFLSDTVSEPLAAAFTGVASIVFAGITAWFVRRLIR